MHGEGLCLYIQEIQAGLLCGYRYWIRVPLLAPENFINGAEPRWRGIGQQSIEYQVALT